MVTCETARGHFVVVFDIVCTLVALGRLSDVIVVVHMYLCVCVWVCVSLNE